MPYFLSNLKPYGSDAFNVAWSIASRRSVVGSTGLNGMGGSDCVLLAVGWNHEMFNQNAAIR